ncbi:MAG TPA: succinate dehydrogenase [Bacillota bacterium]
MSDVKAEPRSRGNFELITWFFMRISGIILLFLVLGHWAIMHILHDIEQINYAFVAERWTSPFWRTYDMLLLWLALLHGANGLRVIVDDYARHRGWRIFWLSVLYTVAGILLVMGTLVLVTFEPAA